MRAQNRVRPEPQPEPLPRQRQPRRWRRRRRAAGCRLNDERGVPGVNPPSLFQARSRQCREIIVGELKCHFRPCPPSRHRPVARRRGFWRRSVSAGSTTGGSCSSAAASASIASRMACWRAFGSPRSTSASSLTRASNHARLFAMRPLRGAGEHHVDRLPDPGPASARSIPQPVQFLGNGSHRVTGRTQCMEQFERA
jgi:hypothetical protein